LARVAVRRNGVWEPRFTFEPSDERWQDVSIALGEGAEALGLFSTGGGTMAWGAPTIRTRAASALPHVIVFVLDAVRRDGLSAYERTREPRPTSPFFDALAARGALFEDTLSPFGGTWEGSVALFSGYHPETTGAFDGQRLPPGMPTVLRSFARAG